MLLFRTQAYLMPEAYSKPCQLSKMMRNNESPDIFRTVSLGISKNIQGHSAIFNHVQAYCGTLKYIEAYSGIFVAY